MSYSPFNYLFTVPPSSGWSWTNQGLATVSTNVIKDQGSIYLRSGVAAPGDNLKVYTRGLSINKTVIAAFRIMNNPGSTAAPYGGLCWRESSSGKLSLFAIIRNNASPYLNGIALYKFNTATSYSGASYSPLFTEAVWTNDLYWVKMQDNATDRIFSISVDGENWHVHHTVGRTDFLTADEWGIFANSNNSDVGVQLISWSET